jgi:HlyD family secretion protein/Biotin-lipoyl like/GAF domain
MEQLGQQLQDPPRGSHRTSQDVDGDHQLWLAFAGAKDGKEFCASWLALQCRMIPAATAGLLLLQRDDATYGPAAIWPDPRNDLSYLKKIAQRALMERKGVIQRTEPTAANDEIARVHVAYPIDIRGRLYGVVALDLISHTGVDLQAVLRQLHWGGGWLESLFWRVQAEEDVKKLNRNSAALEYVGVAEEHPRFQVAAVAVANELASRLGCDRVTIGFRAGKRIRLKAMSHSAWFSQKSQLASGLENVMDEAFDQNASIAWPSMAATERRVAVAHLDFSKSWDVKAIASVVMQSRGQPVGVLTLERKDDRPFEPDTLREAELASRLVGPILALKLQAEDWFSGRLVDSAKGLLEGIFGPRRPALKLAAATVAVLFGVLTIAKTEFRVSAKSVLEGAVQRAAVAPFDGYIAQASVRAGDVVSAGQLLAALNDRDLLSEKTRWETEKSKLVQKHRDALAKHDRANIQIFSEEVGQAEAQLSLVNAKLLRARIVAPIDGVVVSGDLSQLLGAPVTQGKVLFEIAPLNVYRLALQTDERDIGYVRVGQSGELSLTGSAAQTIPFSVTAVTSVATSEEGRNYFRVEARVEETALPLRPGMEGIGKINTGRRGLLWVWTRTLLERIQLFLWAWSP